MDNRKEQIEKDPRGLLIQKLVFKKQEIETAIADLKESRKASDRYRSTDDLFEEMDRADHEMSTQQYYVLLERKCSELKHIETLIRRISKDETFGWCEECGGRIGRKRLSVMPDATRCIQCQQEHEKKESRTGYYCREHKRVNDEDDFADDDIENIQKPKVFVGNIDSIPLSIEDLEDMDLVIEPSGKDVISSSSVNDEG
jgi:DnaK suppressor protein